MAFYISRCDIKKTGKLYLHRVEAYLRREYVEKGRSRDDIAKECGVTEQCIKSYLNKFGIIHKKEYVKKEWLEARVLEGMRIKDIAPLAQVSSTTIGIHIRKHGLKYPAYHHLDWCLERLKEQTVAELAGDVGLGKEGLKYILKQFAGIRVEPILPLKPYDNYEELKKWREKGLSYEEIACKYGVVPYTIITYMRKFGLSYRGHLKCKEPVVKLKLGQWVRFEYKGKNHFSGLSVAGCYVFFCDGRLVYVGQSQNIRVRLAKHFQRNGSKDQQTLFDLLKVSSNVVIGVRQEKRRYARFRVEALLVDRLSPSYNYMSFS